MGMTAESECLAQILAYLIENKRKSSLEGDRLQNLALKAKEGENGQQEQTTASES